MDGNNSDSEDSFFSSSSSDDDEEFLTTSKSKSSKSGKKSSSTSSEDREALIRRKLLESFYGKAAAETATSSNNTGGGEEDGDFTATNNAGSNSTDNTNASSDAKLPTTPHRHPYRNSQHHPPTPQSPSSTDLDSPSFHPTLYSSNLISTSTTHNLLSSSSDLTQSIRLLDSTMQTLVYENYSKFIDATDAIRSIGQSVSVSEKGLQTLSSSIVSIEQNMKHVEHELKHRRNEVAEKIRVKRLLMRLTRLLELPVTLKVLCGEKKYRSVMRDYYDAMVIIGQHSEGFESLKKIEMDCGFIVERMVWDLGRMVWVWCGGDSRGRLFNTNIMTNMNGSINVHNGGIALPMPARGAMRRASSTNSAMSTGGGIMGVSDVLDTFLRNGRMLFQISSTTTAATAITTMTHHDDQHDLEGQQQLQHDDEGDGNAGENEDETNETNESTISMSSITDVVGPPQSISEIFECTSALLTYALSSSSTTSSAKSTSIELTDSSMPPSNDNNKNEAIALLSKLTSMECQVATLECCTKYLEGILEDHIVDLQEEKLKILQEEEVRMAVGAGAGTGNVNGDNEDEEKTSKNDKHALFPRIYLDTILEAATLYGVIYQQGREKGNAVNNHTTRNKRKNAPNDLLNDYVSIWFTSFLGHVRMVLMERISEIDLQKQSRRNRESSIGSVGQNHPGSVGGHSGSSRDDDDEEDDAAFANISHELLKLLSNVREVASSLALPEIGVDMELAMSLVDKTVGITESMVKKRVSQKFHLLRVRVLKECLLPLVKEVLSEEAGSGDGCGGDSLKTIKTVQAANVALSDGMQMVDDTIRSILSRGTALGMSKTPLDSDMVKVAVSNNAQKFAFWLASVLENIAGCDPVDGDIILSVELDNKNADGHESQYEKVTSESILESKSMDEDEVESPDTCKEHDILENICDLVQENVHHSSNGLLCLSLVEMCRLAARNVVNNMNQSISSSMEEDMKQSLKKDVFQIPSQAHSSSIDSDEKVSTRFRLAAARALILYATTKGYEAASGVCHDIWDSCSIQSEFFPHGPNEVSWKILEVAKSTSIECAAAFGGDLRAGPIPDFNNDNNNYMSGISGRHGAIKGLSLDVARMFTQKIQVYPHHSEIIDFTRNAVVTLMLKVSFKAWIEQIRSCTLSAFAYRQLQVDTEFLKILLPHYIEEESTAMEELQSILSDIVLNAGGRCEDIDCVGVTEYYDEARGKVLSPNSIAMGFLVEEEAAGKRGVLGKFLIEENVEMKDEKSL